MVLNFVTNCFDNLCVESGIQRHSTVPYTPQQNGVAERINRTLLERVRCMLACSGLSKKFWGEAVCTTVYLINRSPSVPFNGKFPEFVWSGTQTDLSNLKVFSCSAFVHQKQDKIEPRLVKCVFLRYPDGVKAATAPNKVEHLLGTSLVSENVQNVFVVDELPEKLSENANDDSDMHEETGENVHENDLNDY
ncbi:uncharacterized mitochondrial protein AtMg00710-like [Henckelia pumila]|uniref:uncharacterized mitochondrial protein AtMg00710-like n=1 Tax=Henckelia pumila TaxID=405737 RepID=UPI003C6E08DA